MLDAKRGMIAWYTKASAVPKGEPATGSEAGWFRFSLGLRLPRR